LRQDVRFVVGSDHAGLPLKAPVIAELERLGHQVRDLGTFDDSPVDYPDYALAVAEPIAAGEAHRGVLLCGSGIGACVAANKVPGVRAGTCHDTFSAHQGVEDDDMNVLCLGARVIGPNLAVEIVRAFQAAVFSDAPRHRKRLQKVNDIEARFAPRPAHE
jgi:ribose 5-phosphate isomerase B